jgi:hypothetical protein
MAKAGMRTMRRIAAVIALVLATALTGFAETVTNVRGSQRPNSNLVDIYYDLNAVDGWSYTVEVAIEGRTDVVMATTFSGDVGTGIAPGKNRHIVWEAGADWRGKKGDVKAIVTATIEAKKVKPKKVQLWAGGPYWADRNIGADAPWKYGLYFWWGDTKGHRPSGTTFNFSFEQSNCPTQGKTPDQLRSEGWIISNDVLAPSHDAAHVHWGGAWRIPTNQELKDLCNKCDWTYTTTNGVGGCIVSGRGTYASNSIFLPYAGVGGGTLLSNAGCEGFYWSSIPYLFYDYCGYALSLYFGPGFQYTIYASSGRSRGSGQSIRPVQGASK